jgi:hypothetical protein
MSRSSFVVIKSTGTNTVHVSFHLFIILCLRVLVNKTGKVYSMEYAEIHATSPTSGQRAKQGNKKTQQCFIRPLLQCTDAAITSVNTVAQKRDR